MESWTLLGCICDNPMERSDDDSMFATFGSMTGKLTVVEMPRFSATVAEVETMPSGLVSELTDAEKDSA